MCIRDSHITVITDGKYGGWFRDRHFNSPLYKISLALLYSCLLYTSVAQLLQRKSAVQAFAADAAMLAAAIQTGHDHADACLLYTSQKRR